MRVTDEQDVRFGIVEHRLELVARGRPGVDPAHVGLRLRVPEHDANAVDVGAPCGRQGLQERDRSRGQVPAGHVRTVLHRPAVVVAADAGDLSLAQELQRLLWEQPEVDEVSAADDLLDAELIDLYECVAQRVNVRVDVGDHRELRHACRGPFDVPSSVIWTRLASTPDSTSATLLRLRRALKRTNSASDQRAAIDARTAVTASVTGPACSTATNFRLVPSLA